jgi:two-component system nitrate/nitrite response regulator NarL
LVADDHPAVLQTVVDVLASVGIEVVGRAQDGEDALAKIEALRPDIALLDVRMPKITGIELARLATRSTPETAIVLYTAYGDSALLFDAMDAGARALILKEAPLADLPRALETVRAGGTYVDPLLAGHLARTESAEMPGLNKRERDVLRLLADGLSNEQIGERLFLSPETVKSHVRKAMRKLDADTRTAAVARALRESLIS